MNQPEKRKERKERKAALAAQNPKRQPPRSRKEDLTMEAPIGAIWAWIGVGEEPAITTFVGGGTVLSAVFGRLFLEQRFQKTH
jgi:hypothetical protein